MHRPGLLTWQGHLHRGAAVAHRSHAQPAKAGPPPSEQPSLQSQEGGQRLEALLSHMSWDKASASAKTGQPSSDTETCAPGPLSSSSSSMHTFASRGMQAAQLGGHATDFLQQRLQLQTRGRL